MSSPETFNDFLCAGFTKPGVTRGLLLGILGGGVPLGSPNPDPIPDQKTVIFHTLFQTSPLFINITCTQIRTPTKRFLKIHFEFAYNSFFLIHLELKRQILSYTPVIPSKTILDSRQKWINLYPSSSRNGAKTIPYEGGIYLYVLYRGEPPSTKLSYLSYLRCSGLFRLIPIKPLLGSKKTLCIEIELLRST